MSYERAQVKIGSRWMQAKVNLPNPKKPMSKQTVKNAKKNQIVSAPALNKSYSYSVPMKKENMNLNFTLKVEEKEHLTSMRSILVKAMEDIDADIEALKAKKKV